MSLKSSWETFPGSFKRISKVHLGYRVHADLSSNPCQSVKSRQLTLTERKNLVSTTLLGVEIERKERGVVAATKRQLEEYSRIVSTVTRILGLSVVVCSVLSQNAFIVGKIK